MGAALCRATLAEPASALAGMRRRAPVQIPEVLAAHEFQPDLAQARRPFLRPGDANLDSVFGVEPDDLQDLASRYVVLTLHPGPEATQQQRMGLFLPRPPRLF